MKNIHEAMNAVMQDVGYVRKQRGKNLNYTYAGEAALIKALRPSIVDAGIVVYPADVEVLKIGTYETSKGTSMNHVIVKAAYNFVHAASGTEVQVIGIGEGSDVGDKAVNKANTGAYKYALRQAFLIETGDDPDATASVPRSAAPKKPAQKKPAQKATADTRTPPKWKPAAIAWMVDDKIATNSHNAAAIWDLVDGNDCADKGVFAKRVQLYRRWRDETDAEAQVAATHAIAGNEPA